MRDGGGAQRPLPVAANAQNGAVGEARVHPHPSATAGDASAAVPVRDAPLQPRNAASGLLPLPAHRSPSGGAHCRRTAEAAVQSAFLKRGVVLVAQVSSLRGRCAVPRLWWVLSKIGGLKLPPGFGWKKF